MINSLQTQIARSVSSDDYPLAANIESNVPIYHCPALTLEKHSALRIELANNLLSGPGVFVLKNAFQDIGPIDEATAIFLEIIEQEKQSKGEGADHFAKSGANDRVWNSLEKLCLASPDVFARYHSNPWIKLASEAWLGPAYHVTAQVNLVRPGGEAQEAHCDYHLGFMTKEQVELYPPHVHKTSAQLTLQGAVAHCDMPIESGTTKLLPFSQNWPNNYSHFRDPQVRNLFAENAAQLPLNKGDLLFFSPGLLHAAGDNFTSNIDRMANLLQVSSAFGVPLERINRVRMCKTLYPTLLAMQDDGRMSADEIGDAIESCGEGYPFPTNLDSDPPVGGLAPASQQALMRQGLIENWPPEKFDAELDSREAKRVA